MSEMIKQEQAKTKEDAFRLVIVTGMSGGGKTQASRYLEELRRISGSLGDIDAAEHALRNGMDGNYFSTTLSRLQQALKKRLGVAAPEYLINDGGRRPRLYALLLARESITLVE